MSTSRARQPSAEISETLPKDPSDCSEEQKFADAEALDEILDAEAESDDD